MSYTVCNTVTHRVSDHVTNAVRTSVQNQNQNQRFWLLLLVLRCGHQIHPSLQSVEGARSVAAAPFPAMDEEILGGSC